MARGLIVQWADGESGRAARSAATAANAALPGRARVAATTSARDQLSVIGFDQLVSTADAAKAAAAVERQPGVQWAVPDQLRRAAAVTSTSIQETASDPYYLQQYNLADSRGYSTGAGYLWPATHGRSTVVAVVDTGVLAKHPDLAGRTVAGYDFVSSSAFSNDGNGRDSDPTDPGDYSTVGECGRGVAAENSSWHGTHVAGIIAASADNGQGVSGIAPGARIEPVRVMGACGGFDSDIIAGIEWAAGAAIRGAPVNKNPAKVINVSLGGSRYSGYSDSCVLYAAAARVAAAHGAIIVTAAGNDSADPSDSSPAGCDGYVTVAATGRTGHAAYYTDKGSSVALSAPGGDELVDGQGIWSTLSDGATKVGKFTYGQMEGTSMAAPAVSAAAAMIYSLGIHSPSALTRALEAAVRPFAGATAGGVDWSSYTVAYGSLSYTFDLTCSTSTCGSGVLDLAKVPAPAGKVTLSGLSSGRALVGRRLSVNSVWTGPGAIAKIVRWYVGGKHVATQAGYTVPAGARGQSVQARVSPASGAFSSITAASPTYVAQ